MNLILANIALDFARAHWKPTALAALAALAVGLWQWDRHRQFAAGQASERRAAIERANDLIKQRAKDDAQIRNLDGDALCREFGFKRLPDGSCG